MEKNIKDETYTISYDDMDGRPTGFIFTVKALDAKGLDKLIEKSTKGSTYNIRTGQTLNQGNIDFAAFQYSLIKDTIVDWKGLTNTILLDIMQEDKVVFKGNPPRRDTEIPFSNDVLEEIANEPSPDFIQYIQKVFIKVIPLLRKQKRLAELKN